ncbi:MAG: hypothetical protein P0Y66_20235 [Candidatus Kaistia colombiensis]|nr:MAG: hypothetical protein P0Y66_20235 [Kaistia sp.]
MTLSEAPALTWAPKVPGHVEDIGIADPDRERHALDIGRGRAGGEELHQIEVFEAAEADDAPVAHIALRVEARISDDQRADHPRAEQAFERGIVAASVRQGLEERARHVAPVVGAQIRLDKIGGDMDDVRHQRASTASRRIAHPPGSTTNPKLEVGRRTAGVQHSERAIAAASTVR